MVFEYILGGAACFAFGYFMGKPSSKALREITKEMYKSACEIGIDMSKKHISLYNKLNEGRIDEAKNSLKEYILKNKSDMEGSLSETKDMESSYKIEFDEGVKKGLEEEIRKSEEALLQNK